MAVIIQLRASHREAKAGWWRLWISIAIATLGIGGSLVGLGVDRIYALETREWAGEAVGQDIANLIVFTAMLTFAYAAARGSLKAELVWTGTLVYSAYTYAIYAFDVHFGPLFLLYVAVFGLSAWALGSTIVAADPASLKRRFAAPHLVAFAANLLIVVSAAFALLWLSEDVAATIDGSPSEALAKSGLATNPVHVLDLSLLLPACLFAGFLLRRGQAWGYYLVPVLLTAASAIGTGIVTMMIVLSARGEETSLVVAAVIGALVVVQVGTVWRFLQGIGAVIIAAQEVVGRLPNGAR